ncbi:MAG: response regulator, partial [Candidatus Polarisedimenticolaceae bacterium]|nr:response regulator [Candidatus Polarisedimenticolaceae bacterium]
KKQVMLVVDDSPMNLDLIKGILGSEHTVRIATNGKIALKIVEQHPPDLILLDIMMPEMDGYEVCRRLKSQPKSANIPIIFVTAMNEVLDEVKGLDAGAIDYITKPISGPILLARVRTHLALKRAEQVVIQQRQKLQEERETIEGIVIKMREDPHFNQQHLRFLVSPVEETSGDILLSTFKANGTQHLMLGDFTGHGLPAAIGGPLVSHLFYSMSERNCGAVEIIAEINKVLYKHLPSYLFLAAAFVEIPATRKQFRVWNAGLQDTLLVHKGEGRQYPSDAPPLGCISDHSVGEGRLIPLTEGDRFYIFSDGIIEEVDRKGEMFGYDRFKPLLIKLANNEISLNEIQVTIEQFCQPSPQTDDITLVELQP